MASEAAGLIGALHARGMSNAAIGRAVGRDSSLIAQGAKGAKPLNNLVPALRNLAEGRTPGTPERRAQAVRQGATRLGGGQLHLKTGRGNADVKNFLKKAAAEKKQVQATPTFSNVKRGGKSGTGGKVRKSAEVSMFQKGGWDAQQLLDRIQAEGGDALRTLEGMARSMPGVERIGKLQSVQLYAYNPA